MRPEAEHPSVELASLKTRRPLYRLALYSLLGGSTSLLPLPLVDDWAFAWVRRRLIQEVCRPSISLGDSSTRILLDRGRYRESQSGCLGLVLRTPLRVLIYVIARLFRKIFFFSGHQRIYRPCV